MSPFAQTIVLNFNWRKELMQDVVRVLQNKTEKA